MVETERQAGSKPSLVNPARFLGGKTMYHDPRYQYLEIPGSGMSDHEIIHLSHHHGTE